MKRLFLALALNEQLKISANAQLQKTKISAKKKGLDIRWTPMENLHVTLVFLGDTKEERIPEIVATAKEAAALRQPFELKIKGAGAFPDISHGRVLWLKVQAKKDLVELQKELSTRSAGKGFALDEREWKPHLTVGRLRNKSNLSDVLSPVLNQNFGKMQASEVVLYESKLEGHFPKYLPLETMPLGRSGL